MTTKRKRTEKKVGKEAGQLRKQLVRVLADYDNLRKRTAKEREILLKFSAERIISRLLPVLDVLGEAQKHLQDSGLAIVIDDFKKVLYDERLEEILPEKGDNFDPELCEAVESLTGGKKGQIAKLVLGGWRFIDGPVIRYAQVKVFGEKTKRKD